MPTHAAPAQPTHDRSGTIPPNALPVNTTPSNIPHDSEIPSRHTVCASDSVSKHTVCASDSVSKHTACASDSVSKHTASASDSASKHTACASDSASKHTACASGIASKHTASASDSVSKHTACASGSASKHTACASGIASKHTVCEPEIPRASHGLRAPSCRLAVLRTLSTWVDRVRVRVAYVLLDAYGSSAVSRPSRVRMELSPPTTSLTAITISCSTAHTQSSRHVDGCSATSLPSAWFGGAAQTSIVRVRLYEGGAVIATASAGQLRLSPHPSWWDHRLQAATVGNGLSAPAGVDDDTGVFLTLPVSPVHAGEQFVAHVYASTARLPLTAWRVRLYFSSSVLLYASFSQNGHFNPASSSVSAGEVSWLATGIKSTTAQADVTGAAIFLLRLVLRVAPSVAAGTYSGAALALYPRATELVSGDAFLRDRDGVVFDGREAGQTRGQLSVLATPQAIGIFVSAPGGALANLHVLTGEESRRPLEVTQVSDDDRSERGDSAVDSAAATCASAAEHRVLQLQGCSVVLGANQTASATSVQVDASYNGLRATTSFDVYAPQSTSISLSDHTLNRFGSSAGGLLSPCTAHDETDETDESDETDETDESDETDETDETTGGRTVYPYQRALASAHADGLDVTPLVSFVVSDTRVAGVSRSRFNVIEGKGAGAAAVHLLRPGRLLAEPSAALIVSDSAVTASALIARVVTRVSWSDRGQPSAQYAAGDVVMAAAALSNSMAAEGDGGYMYARVVWSDGAGEDVGYAPRPGVEELNVTVRSSGVAAAAPATDETRWWLGVAVGATKECVETTRVTWLVCGAEVVSGVVPLLLDLPDPISATVVILCTRLTSPSDDAARSPASVPTSSQLTLLVTFDDGTSRDLSSDDRVSYSTPDVQCAATAHGDGSASTLRIASNAACTEAEVEAIVRLGAVEFIARHTRPVVYVASMVVSFGGFPDTGSNRDLAVTALGLVPCSTSRFFHATARVTLTLTDTSSVDITRSTGLASNAPLVVYVAPGSTRMQARSQRACSLY